MKNCLLLFTAMLSFGLFTLPMRAQDGPPPPPADTGGDQGAPPDQGGGQDQADFQTFYNQLGSDGSGNWIQTDQYGYVFQPNVSDPNWAPYTQGNWAYSNAGWTWNSSEPWGWATYHYGRWVNIDGTGWVWVPGTRWAPSWVSWRYGDGYVGWAPLPPDTLQDTDYGDADFHFGDDIDVSFDIGPGCYNFIPYGDFGYDDCGQYIVPRYNNYIFIGRTRNVTDFNYYHDRRGFDGVRAGGPSFAEINAHSSRHVSQVTLTASNNPRSGGIHGNSAAFYAPRFNSATARQGKPAHVAGTLSHVAVNRGLSISHPLQVTQRVKGATPSATVVSQARQAQASLPATAKLPHVAHTAATGAGSNVHADTAATGEAAIHPANTVHAESAATGESEHHTESKPATTHTAETETHHTESAPSLFHPEAETHTAEATHTEEHSAPAPTEEHHTEAAHTETHSEPSHTESHASAPHPEEHSAPKPSGGGGGKPSGGGDKGKGDDKNGH
jgi:hypothetical protein